jgi:hypothetical protein
LSEESKENNRRKSEKGKKKDENQERTAHANRDRGVWISFDFAGDFYGDFSLGY